MTATLTLTAIGLSALLLASDNSPQRIQTATDASVMASTTPVTRLGLALGDPLPGLTPAELAAFRSGRAVFDRRFRPSEGLGPLYNAVSCRSCHSTPVAGGSSELYRNFYVGVFETVIPPTFQGPLPDLPSVIIPAFGSGPHISSSFTLQGGRYVIPDMLFGILPVISAQRNALSVFGTGLFEFIDNATILANTDPDDLDGDGISGRANFDIVGLGRFGVKAQVNNIELFTRGPLQFQMGVTSDPFLGDGSIVTLSAAFAQVGGGVNDPTLDNDGIPDPEIDTSDLGDLIAFTRFLAPPQRESFTPLAEEGQELFDVVGCAKCHIPSLNSSRFGPVEAYTDLLLHDVGAALADGIRFGTPQPSMIDPDHTAGEFRTTPLWGVSDNGPFLHDGRAGSLRKAILMHGGEAQDARDQFSGLDSGAAEALIAFLEEL